MAERKSFTKPLRRHQLNKKLEMLGHRSLFFFYITQYRLGDAQTVTNDNNSIPELLLESKIYPVMRLTCESGKDSSMVFYLRRK